MVDIYRKKKIETETLLSQRWLCAVRFYFWAKFHIRTGTKQQKWIDKNLTYDFVIIQCYNILLALQLRIYTGIKEQNKVNKPPPKFFFLKTYSYIAPAMINIYQHVFSVLRLQLSKVRFELTTVGCLGWHWLPGKVRLPGKVPWLGRNGKCERTKGKMQHKAVDNNITQTSDVTFSHTQDMDFVHAY